MGHCHLTFRSVKTWDQADDLRRTCQREKCRAVGFIIVFDIARTCSMNNLTAGVKVRPFRVTITTGSRGPRFTGSFFRAHRFELYRTVESVKTVKYRPVTSNCMRNCME